MINRENLNIKQECKRRYILYQTPDLFADQHNTLPKSTRRNPFGTPWLLDLLCKHWFTSSVWNFCSWGADISLSKISLAARSDGCFTSYSFSKFQTYLSFTSQTLILHQFFNPSDNCNQFAFPRVVQNIGLPLYVALLSQTHKSQNAVSALF